MGVQPATLLSQAVQQMDNQQDVDPNTSTRAAEHLILRFLQNLHKQVAAKHILQSAILSTMLVKLLSVVAEFCFSPFLVTDQETTSAALETSSLSSQDPQQPNSTGKYQKTLKLKKKIMILWEGHFSHSKFQERFFLLICNKTIEGSFQLAPALW